MGISNGFYGRAIQAWNKITNPGLQDSTPNATPEFLLFGVATGWFVGH